MKREFIYFYEKKFLRLSSCEKIIKEIDKFKLFDDLVTSGRKRINKGSKKFKKFINSSPESSLFFKKINSFKFYNKLMKKLNLKKNHCKWNKNLKNLRYSKSIYGVQTGNKFTNVKTDTKKNIIYLDMDFSV